MRAEPNSSQTPLAVISYGLWRRRFDADPPLFWAALSASAKRYFKSPASPKRVSPESTWALQRTSGLRWLSNPPGRDPCGTSGWWAAWRHLPRWRKRPLLYKPCCIRAWSKWLGVRRGSPQSLINRILGLQVKLISAGGGISPVRGEAGRPLLIVFGLVVWCC